MRIIQLKTSKIPDYCDIAIDLDNGKIYLPEDGSLFKQNEYDKFYAIETNENLIKAVSIIKIQPNDASLQPIFYSSKYEGILSKLISKSYTQSITNSFYCAFVSRDTNNKFQLENIPVLKIKILNKTTIDITMMDIDVANKTFDKNTVNAKDKIEVYPEVFVVYDEDKFNTSIGLDIKKFIIPIIRNLKNLTIFSDYVLFEYCENFDNQKINYLTNSFDLESIYEKL